MNTQQRRILDAAEAFIASQKSVPFARARVMSHVKAGIAAVNPEGQPHYSATASIESRLTENGEEYKVKVWKDLACL